MALIKWNIRMRKQADGSFKMVYESFDPGHSTYRVFLDNVTRANVRKMVSKEASDAQKHHAEHRIAEAHEDLMMSHSDLVE
jgi:hypothetical protein